MRESTHLTSLQRETLKCIAEGRCYLAFRHFGWRTIQVWLAYGRNATCQVKSLHERGFVRRHTSAGTVALTVAGAFALFFDAEALS